jgi:uncharacterized protein
MTLDWTHFTPWSSLAGGLLIGLAASALVLGAGRILGASGIVGGLIDPRPGDVAWRLWLIVGLMLAPGVLSLLSLAKTPTIATPAPLLVVAGVLVGLGARLGSGCTSGHGVCGIARLSPRSMLATGLFMLAGLVTVFFVRHVLI